MARSGGYDYNRVPGDEGDQLGSRRAAAGATPDSGGQRQSLLPGSPDSPGAQEEDVAHAPVCEAVLRLKKRRTTDICGLCIFCWFWVGMSWIAYTSLRVGNPQRLFHGFDFAGRLCGHDGDVRHKPLLYWPHPQDPNYPVCVSGCPTDTSSNLSVPVEFAVRMNNGDKQLTTITSMEKVVPTYSSIQVGGHFCLPKPGSDRATGFTTALLHQQVQSPVAVLRSWLWDVAKSWPVLLLALTTSFFLGYGYLFLLKCGARALTWGLMGLLVLLSVGIAAYCIGYVGNSQERAAAIFGSFSSHPLGLARTVGVVSGSLAVVLLAFVSYVFSSMKRAVGCVEASCEAIWSQRVLLRLPGIEVLVKGIFTSVWFAVFGYVVSSGFVEAPSLDVNGTPVYTKVRHFTTPPQQKISIAYYVVGYIWGVEMLTAVFQFATCYCAVMWYFSPTKDGATKAVVDPGTWKTAFRVGFRYHLGSLAVGAAISGIFRPIAGVATFIAKHAHAGDNAASKALASTCMCCIWCFEEIVRFVNKNAIIQLVLQSSDFITSAAAATRLLTDVRSDVAPINGITMGFQYIGMLAIASLSAGLTVLVTGSLAVFAEPSSEWFIENRVIVALTAALLASAISSAFMSLFDVVSDSLLFCWLTECEDGTTEFAPKSLRSVLGDPAKPETGGAASRFTSFVASTVSAAASGLASAAQATGSVAAQAVSKNLRGGRVEASANTEEDWAAMLKEVETLRRRLGDAEAARKASEATSAERLAVAEAARKAAEETAACLAAEQERAREAVEQKVLAEALAAEEAEAAAKAAAEAAASKAARAAAAAEARRAAADAAQAAPEAPEVAKGTLADAAPEVTEAPEAVKVGAVGCLAEKGVSDVAPHSMAAASHPEPEKTLAGPSVGDFRAAPPECWSAIHARFAPPETEAPPAEEPLAPSEPLAAPEPTKGPGPAREELLPSGDPPHADPPATPMAATPSGGDFRAAPPEYWAALHSRFPAGGAD